MCKLLRLMPGWCLAFWMTAGLEAKPPDQPPPPAALPASIDTSKARITFASKDFEFGRIPQGDVVSAEFVFTNTGLSTLEIIDVRPGCGCTTTTNWDRLVEPGKIGRIGLHFNSRNFNGQVSKPATVTCNDPTSPTVILQIKGEIWKPIDVQPNFVYFGSIDPGTNDVRTAKVINNTSELLRITDLQSTNPMFRAELKEVVPGKEFEIRVSTVPPLKGPNPQTLLLAKTSSTSFPELRLTAMALVQEPVVAVPRTVMLPAPPYKGASQYMVSIRNNRPSIPMAIEKATINLTNVTVRVTEQQPGRVYNILLAFPNDFQMPPGTVGQLVVETTHPEGKRLAVNVVQLSSRGAPIRTPSASAPAPLVAAPASTRPATNPPPLQ